MVLFVLWKCKNIHCFLASLVAQQVKNLPAMHESQETWVWSLGSGRSPGGGHGDPLQCSCLENPVDRGAWRATVHRVAKSQTRLKRLSTHAHVHFFMSTKKKKKRKEKPGMSYGPNVHPKLTCWNFTSQCDAIRRWGLGEVIKIRWGHEGEDLINGLIPAMRKPASPLSSLPSEDTIKN